MRAVWKRIRVNSPLIFLVILNLSCGQSHETPAEGTGELNGGITSGGYIVEQSPQTLAKRGIVFSREGEAMEVLNAGKSQIKLIAAGSFPGATIEPGEKHKIECTTLTGVNLLEVRDSAGTYLGSVDVEKFFQTSRSL